MLVCAEGGCDVDGLAVVCAVGGLLAAGAIGADSLSDRVDHSAAVPAGWHRGRWGFRITARDYVFASAGTSRSADGIG